MLGNYLQQMTSVDNIFRCFFIGPLRVEEEHSGSVVECYPAWKELKGNHMYACAMLRSWILFTEIVLTNSYGSYVVVN